MTETNATLVPFTERGLRPTILAALQKKGYETPTPIQDLTFKHFVAGHHLVGQSQTGSGKTAAFLLPMLNVINPKEAAPQILILAPTRELALQTEEEAFELTRGLFGAKTALVCGGMSFRNQITKIQHGANVIIGTPGRVLAMLEKNILQTNQLRYFVLDEVDRMLDMGFIDEVEAIWSKLPHKMQVLCFSATMPPEVKSLFDSHLEGGYQHIEIEKEHILVHQLDHSFLRVREMEKLPYLEEYLKSHDDVDKVLVFAQTKKSVDDLQDLIHVDGYETMGLHGGIDQYERINAMKAFKQAKKVILIATDVASRGLNLNNVDLVVNFDMPQDPEDYVHRVGRTARAGQPGKALMFVTPSEEKKLRMLERANKIEIKEVDREGNIVPRPVHQKGSSGAPYTRERFQRNRRQRGGSSGGGKRFGGERKSYGEQRSSSSYGEDRRGGYRDGTAGRGSPGGYQKAPSQRSHPGASRYQDSRRSSGGTSRFDQQSTQKRVVRG